MNFFKNNRVFSRFTLLISLIPGAGLVTVLSIRSDSGSSAFAAIPLFFQSIIGVIIGAILFAPKWATLPIKTENEFILYRYKDPFAKPLFYFRAFYLGWIIIPLLMSISLSSLFNPSLFTKSDQQYVIPLFVLFCIVFTFYNSLKQRIKLDLLIGSMNVVFAIVYMLYSFWKGAPSNATFVQTNNLQTEDVFLICGVFWWFNNVIDMPDMRAQKLLVLRSQKLAALIVITPVIFMFSFEAFLVWGPQPPVPRFIIQTFIFINLLQVISSLQHWSGALTHESIFSHLYKKSPSTVRSSYISLLIPLIISFVWTFFYRNTADTLLTFFGLTAGVGIVYILRWYWWRINALTQLVAMVGALLISSVISFYRESWLVTEIIAILPFQTQFSVLLIIGLINMLCWFPTLYFFPSTKSAHSKVISKHLFK